MNRKSAFSRRIPCAFLAIFLVSAATHAQDTTWLSSLDISKMRQGWGEPQRNRSVLNKILSVAGRQYQRGVGTHARSVLWIDLGRKGLRFLAFVGVDDSAGGHGSVKFKIYGDGRTLFESGMLRSGDEALGVDLDLRGIEKLVLTVNDAGDGIGNDHADWCEARFITGVSSPKAIDPPTEEAIVLTPSSGKVPRINGASVTGCRAGSPFLFRIPCTGARPIKFSAQGLPASLKLVPASGVITGTVTRDGKYLVKLRAKNRYGSSSRMLRIICGQTLALTPPMGWNHWYAHYGRITDALVREAADIMVSSGMADVGYQYVDIDDCWMNSPKNDDSMRVGPLRDDIGDILPNACFPDMKALTDYIHSKGLKAGIYTSPGPLTCAGYTGSYLHEARDARRFSEWGFDFLKYDWCSYRSTVGSNRGREMFMKPYKLMGAILKEQKRDIVFNLCQYGMGNVWEWGESVGGNCWRTAGDLGVELDRFFDVALKNSEHRGWSRPGAWNDPDYIQIGYIGDARSNGLPAPCGMTPNEQYAFMSLWCLMASPLFYSGDMGKLDPFTLNVLCNPEVIDVDQDPLGQGAAVAMLSEETFLMVKEMADGSKAVGLFNRGEFPADLVTSWALLGLSGAQRIRDLWRQKDLGLYDGQFRTTVPRHGVVLLRILKAQKPATAIAKRH